MPVLYYGTRISENISTRDPEGYLICKDVPIARCGMQEYQARELDLEGVDGEQVVPVYREAEDVFSTATMASFEGMPFTNDHPHDGVDADNIRYLQCGHAQNIRRGEGDLMIADLIITDPQAIQLVRDGKREISCGYTFHLEEKEGRYYQRQIRGNHVALVDQGRAGHSVCIKDSHPENERSNPTMANPEKKASIWARILGVYAKDESTTPEDVAEAMDEIQSITVTTDPSDGQEKSAAATTLAPESTQTVDEDPEETKAFDNDELIEKIAARVVELLKPAQVDQAPAEEDPLDKLNDDLDKGDEQASNFVEPEELNDEDTVAEEETEDEDPEAEEVPAADAASVRMAIQAIKPFIASLPADQRKAASDAAVKQLRKAAGMDATPTSNAYAAIKASKRRASDAAQEDGRELGRRIQAARNCNHK